MQGSGLSYKTAQKANELLEHLPAGPQWSYHTITVDGYEPLKPIILFMRNARECTEYLFNNPLFADRMSLVPIKQYTKDTKERGITEPISAKQAWETQVRVFSDHALFILSTKCCASCRSYCPGVRQGLELCSRP